MATERFEKLSNDKKLRILEAAREEFARVPYEDASINQIIKNAGISRGSFYTYFEDKNDLLRYILKDESDKNTQFFREIVLSNQGDYWKSLKEWTEKVAEYLRGGSIQQSINILTQTGIMRRVVDWVDIQCDIKDNETDQLDWMMEHLDMDKLDVHGDRERMQAILKETHLISGITLLNLIMRPAEDQSDILREFYMQIDIVRCGADPTVRKT